MDNTTNVAITAFTHADLKLVKVKISNTKTKSMAIDVIYATNSTQVIASWKVFVSQNGIDILTCFCHKSPD